MPYNPKDLIELKLRLSLTQNKFLKSFLEYTSKNNLIGIPS